ncbi:MAG: 16S rRNA (cytosine(967)-C(5))-methyltransferase RsmB [Proteobacteria bacterium]|nr:16S rRNA (cytosine(967)-C(5))-methyltransferase RsmB [Pseudomonadota bacterium]
MRAQAARVVRDVIYEGQFIDRALDNQGRSWQGQDRAYLQELCYGTVRWGWRLLALSEQLLSKPLKDKDADIHTLLLVGLYQLIYLRTPSHAAINETVQAARKLRKNWAAGLINACLRQYERDKDKLEAMIDEDEVAKSAHPQWLMEAIRQAWPDYAESIFDANNTKAPMWIRVNSAWGTPSDYLAELAKHTIQARSGASSTGLIIDPAKDVLALPGFNDGWVSVQDGAAQWAAPWLDCRPGQRVLDACSAPGGKLAHIAELYPQLGQLLAVEKEVARIPLIESTLARTRTQAEVIQADVSQTDDWWDGNGFDRILIDAPCSATGVIRRHPDIRFHRHADDIAQLAETQTKILDALWPCLNKGGKLLYATCSILPQENDEQIKAFLARHNDATSVSLTNAPESVITTDYGQQWLPGLEEMDGFYYGCICKH